MTANPPFTAPEFGPPLEQPGAYHALARQIEAATDVGRKVRVAVLSSYTLEFIKPALTVELARLGFNGTVQFSGFGQLESVVFDAGSALHAFEPDLVVFAVRIEDAHLEAVTRARTPDASELKDAARQTVERLTALVQRTLASRRCVALVANFTVPEPLLLGVGDASVAGSQISAVNAANEELRAAMGAIGGAHVWDYAGLVRSRGSEQWTDPRLWYLARIPVAAAHHGWLAQHLARTIRAALLPAAKVLVLDLDNTVWGGVLGDDGVSGLVLGDEYPGSTFKALQRRALALRDRGVLLVVADKNDAPLAEEAFRQHPEMLIKWEDLAAHRVNWGPKSRGIVEMAEELNLGLDAFVFLDDNPLEQAEVRAGAPGVKVLDWEPWGSMNRALAHCPWFDTLSTSSEDFARAELYARDRQRREEASHFQSVEEFLVSLAMRVEVGRTGSVDRDRVAQLIAKTNQFNLTGRRYPVSEIIAFSESPQSSCVAHLRLRDRFGDQGLTAAAVLVKEGEHARIDVFVMSCRVMNRQVEFALMSFLDEVARSWGCTALVGEFVPSKRNAMVRDLYARAGFQAADGGPDAGSATGPDAGARWVLPLTSAGVAWPSMIERDAVA